MPQLTIVPHGDSAAVVLPASVLELLGLHIGDVLEATLDDQQLILRPIEDAARRQLAGYSTSAKPRGPADARHALVPGRSA